MWHAWMNNILGFAATPWGPFVLLLNAYLEAFISPFPHDPVLMTVALADPKNSFLYAAMSVLAALLGMASSYGVGRWGRKTSLIKIFGNKHMAEIQALIQRYQNKATLVALFTPVPDKLYCMMAGLMKLDFKTFMLIAFTSRFCRYFLTATLVFIYGESIRNYLHHSLHWVLLAVVLVGVGVYFATKLFYSFLDRRLNLTVVDGQKGTPIRAASLEEVGPGLDKKRDIPVGDKKPE